MTSAAVPTTTVRAPARTSPWVVVILLSLLYAVSFLDRMIVALLVDPIRADLGVSDTQIGLLVGLGFALLYMIGGIPVAHFVDRGNRRRILIGGVLLWSGTTFLGAFAQSYATLFAARAGVAIGEAVLTPVAVSMIADLFPRERRSLPTSVYAMVGAIMGTGSFVVGAGAVVIAGWLATSFDMAIWRLTLMIVALPGFIMAGLFAWLVAEPVRGQHDLGGVTAASFGEVAIYVWRHAGLYIAFFSGVGFVLAIAMSLVAWVPTLLIREFGVSTAHSGLLFGMTAVGGSIAGTLSVSPVTRLLQRGQAERGVVRGAIFYAVIAVLALLATVQSGSLAILLTGIAFSMFGLSASAVLSPLLVQLATPPGMRARVIALYLSLSGLLSLGIGPLLVPILSEKNPFGGSGLAQALAITSGLALVASLSCYFVAYRGLARLLRAPAD